MSTFAFANSEHSDEMQLNAAFHQGPGSTLFVKVKKILRQKIQYFFENFNLTS